ncbi:metalloendopeptidase [Cryomyces antarcticus]|uniref:Metalloendopeptidase n=1 Tax=Cryomyces antarcticus TaxID=329879 RepID=A0ABR0LPZ9_9PEZI|nr:metalloendopeptidase [Cryomyces antarcticus]
MFPTRLLRTPPPLSSLPSSILLRQRPARAPSLPLRHQQVRHARYQGFPNRGGYGYNPRYQRFQQSQDLLRRWAARPTFYYEISGIGAAAGGFYVYNLEEVPVSHRRRFNVVSADTEAATASQMYDQVVSEYRQQILPGWDPRVKRVQRVLERLIPASGLSHDGWEVHVIEAPEKNAFVIPGGKVFVFSGILPICGTDDGLAAVLGHEIAHNVAHHAAERMSQAFVMLPLVIAAGLTIGAPDWASRMVVDLAFTMPGSRKQESEADYIGLMMMAQSCFDPAAAVALWARMEEAEKGAPPQFLSTHPSSHNRQEKIRQWLPEARERQALSECGGTAAQVGDFKQAYAQLPW